MREEIYVCVCAYVRMYVHPYMNAHERQKKSGTDRSGAGERINQREPRATIWPVIRMEPREKEIGKKKTKRTENISDCSIMGDTHLMAARDPTAASIARIHSPRSAAA